MDWFQGMGVPCRDPFLRVAVEINGDPTRSSSALGPDVFVKCIGAFRREPPKPRAEDLAFGPLQKIRVGNLHQVRRPPMQVLGLDEEVT